jgi:hypothetical protein
VSRSNTLRHSRRACCCERRSGFISCRLGIERPYAESHPAASAWRGQGGDEPGPAPSFARLWAKIIRRLVPV